VTTDLVPAGLRLVPYADADIWLTRTLETDPDVMRELGGAWPEEAIAGIHERRLAAIAPRGMGPEHRRGGR
jgi:hypothetical protein